jgi:hypothetical protein
MRILFSSKFIELIMSTIDQNFIHRSIIDGRIASKLRSARMTFLVSLLGIPFCFAAMWIDLLAGEHLEAIQMVGFLSVLLASLFVLKYYGYIEIVKRIIVLSSIIFFGFTLAGETAFETGRILWFLLIIPLSLDVFDINEGIAWATITLAGVLVYVLKFTEVTPEQVSFLSRYSAVYIFALVSIVAFKIMHERISRELLEVNKNLENTINERTLF